MITNARTLTPLIVVLLAACGSSGDNEPSSPADELFARYSSVIQGQFRGTSGGGPTQAVAPEQACFRQAAISRAGLESSVRNQGGWVTVATPQQWCASLAGSPLCLTALGDRAFAIHDQAFGNVVRTDHMIVLDLEGSRYARFDTSTTLAGTSIARTANLYAMGPSYSAIPPSGRCDSMPRHTETGINGTWAGYKVTYDGTNFSGYTQAHEMRCAEQICTIASAGFGNLAFTDFDEEGAWNLDSPDLMGQAVVSNDGQTLAVWLCDQAVMTSTAALTSCEMFGFVWQTVN